MKYFIFCLILHILVMLVFIVVTLLFSERNRKRKTKHGFMFFAPVFFAVITIAYAIIFAMPVLMDIKNVSSGKYQSYTGYVEEIGQTKTCVTIDGTKFMINPTAPMPEIGEYVKIRYAGSSKLIMEMEAAQDTTFELVE
ncbi:MAG: hypothetical protein K6G47_10825 [Clostridia bacterium]|nr:hypothetical protein [Clostridia bacterium]